jgi:hypothetical protein
VGTAVSVLSAWHPVALAEQAALLDQVVRPGKFGGRYVCELLVSLPVCSA